MANPFKDLMVDLSLLSIMKEAVDKASELSDALSEIIQPVCIGCGKKPEELQEYIVAVEEEDMTPSEYVRQEEGTYNPNNGHFTCTVCYFNMGCPTLPGTRGWKAP